MVLASGSTGSTTLELAATASLPNPLHVAEGRFISAGPTRRARNCRTCLIQWPPYPRSGSSRTPCRTAFVRTFWRQKKLGRRVRHSDRHGLRPETVGHQIHPPRHPGFEKQKKIRPQANRSATPAPTCEGPGTSRFRAVLPRPLSAGPAPAPHSGTGTSISARSPATTSATRGYGWPHKRPVHWYGVTVQRSDLSEGLHNSVGSIGSVISVETHAEEIEAIVGGLWAPDRVVPDEIVEDPSVVAREKHLGDFPVANWPQTLLGKAQDIYTEDGEAIGRQYPSDTGPVDILARSKDGKETHVVELARGRANDKVVGPVQRYMGHVLSELAEKGQTVRGAIIALEHDRRIERALRVAPDIDFDRCQVRFDLHEVNDLRDGSPVRRFAASLAAGAAPPAWRTAGPATSEIGPKGLIGALTEAARSSRGPGRRQDAVLRRTLRTCPCQAPGTAPRPTRFRS